MTSAIELSCDTFRCQIAPDLGGVIAGLWLGNRPVLCAIPTYRVPEHSLDADCVFPDVDHCRDGWPGVRVLRPGESMSAEISIPVERIK